jgi:hypothetical protein
MFILHSFEHSLFGKDSGQENLATLSAAEVRDLGGKAVKQLHLSKANHLSMAIERGVT